MIEGTTIETRTNDALRQLGHEFEGREDEVRALCRTWLAAFRDCRSVIDLACGEGYFLDELQAAGIAAEGVEVDLELVERARARGLQVAHDSLFPFLTSRPPETCDGVYASHIIEHFQGRDAMRLLLLAERALEPGGTLVVITPNWRHATVVQEVFWLDLTHVRPYPEPLLRRMVEVAGFEVLESGARNTGLQDTYVVARKPFPWSA